MLLGEYAVLYGFHALVCAIDKRIHVTIVPRIDQKIKIESALGSYETTLSHLDLISPFEFVLASLQAFKKNLQNGCDILIESEFSENIGFASSAAVTVAVLRALSAWHQLSFSKPQLIKLARKIIQRVQGTGSGADAAACVMGGIVLYRIKPFVAEKFSSIHPMTVVYSGSKTKTPHAIQWVQEKFRDFPKLYSRLMKTIDECVLLGALALHEKNWQKLGNVMTVQQELMSALGVNTKALQSIIDCMRDETSLYGAKISGAGLGDCVVALGESKLETGLKQIPVNMTLEGVKIEKI